MVPAPPTAPATASSPTCGATSHATASLASPGIPKASPCCPAISRCNPFLIGPRAPAAVSWLRARSDIRKDRVGLWGFSQGATVAPLAASESSDVAFVIEVSGYQLPIWQQDLYRVEAELKADGFSKANIAKAMEIARLRMNLLRESGHFEELDETQKEWMGRPWFVYVQPCDRKQFELGMLAVQYDPAPCWKKCAAPYSPSTVRRIPRRRRS